MQYAVMPKKDYEHACDVLRDYTGESAPIKSGELEENIDKVFGAGEAAGAEKGYSDGYSAGHKQGVTDGLDKTNDATATTDKVVEGETYYAGGKKQTGNLQIAVGGMSAASTPYTSYIGSEECVALSYTPDEPKVIYPSQGGITLKAPCSAFGNAERQNVEKGKTFTSCEGFLMEGTGDTYDDGYNEGYNKGVEDATTLPTLFGSYLLSENVNNRSFPLIAESLDTSGMGVKAYFWNGSEYCYDEVSSVTFGGQEEYSLVLGSSRYSDTTYSKIAGWSPSDARCRVVTFTQPTEVPHEFNENWIRACRGAEGTPYEVGYNGGVEAQPTPTIDVSSGGLITATAGEKSATKQLTTQGAKTITPRTSAQTAIPAGTYATGAVTVAGNSNLIASNIKSGVTIFGVTGTFDNQNLGYELGYEDGYYDVISKPIVIIAQEKGTILATDNYSDKDGMYERSTFTNECIDFDSIIEYEVTQPAESETEVTVYNHHSSATVIVFWLWLKGYSAQYTAFLVPPNDYTSRAEQDVQDWEMQGVRFEW